MGKLKRGRKNKKSRLNPLKRNGSESKSGGVGGGKEEMIRESKVLPLISQLSSKIPNEKAIALSSIAVIIEDSHMRKLFLKEKLIATVMEQCLNDTNDEIVVEAFGLIRNIAIDEGEGAIIHLWRSNIWASIEAALAKIQHSFKYLAENNTQKNSNHKSKVALLYSFTENLISLIIVIAGGSEEMYDKIFEKLGPITEFVLELIYNQVDSQAKFKVSTKLFNSCLEFIYEFSQESLPFVQNLINNEKFNLNQLVQYTNNQNNKLSMIYTEGIKFNYSDVLSQGSNQNEIASEILSKLCDLISDIDLEEFKRDLNNSEEEPIKKSNESNQIIDSINADTKMQASVTNLTCIEVALDLFTSTFEYLSENESDSRIRLSDELIDILMNKVSPVLVALLKFELENEGLTSLSTKLLRAINNLVWLMLSNESLPVAWYDICVYLWNTLPNSFGIKNNLEEKALPSTVCWGLAKSLGAAITDLEGTSILLQQIENIMQYPQIIENQTDEEEKEELLGENLPLIGLYGCFSPVLDSHNASNIGKYLFYFLGLYSSANPICNELVVESLNSIYDLFGDKDIVYDEQVFVQENYLQQLIDFEPKMKSMFKKIDKKKYGFLKAKAEEAWMNLGRFIQYKKSERKV